MSGRDEARLAIAAGAAAIGLVSEMPSGPGVISEGLIADIVSSVPPTVTTFLLTSRQDADGIVAQQRSTGVTAIQICDRLAREDYDRLRAALPRIRLVQVIHVTDGSVVREARALAPLVDALLLDTGNPSAAIKVLGGTGRTHDWAISRQIRDLVEVPIYLAGGLHPDNVAEAIQRVRPAAVDVCSGVRTNGRLDSNKLRRFFDAAWLARW